MDVLATQLAEDLNGAASKEDLEDIIRDALDRVQESITWTRAFAEAEHGQRLENAIRACLDKPQYMENRELASLRLKVLEARRAHLQDEDIRQVQALWWQVEALPESVQPITLEFRDITSEHKAWLVDSWPPEIVEAAPSEAFQRIAQRFRVKANKKYRHPFWPSRHFDAVLQSGRFSFDSLSARTLGDLLPQLGEECVIPYIRNDEDNWIEATRSPARYFQLWERTLPSWCVTPDHWVEPIPPPGYAVQHTLQGPHTETYKKIPTLHIAGTGRHILPAAKVPQIISRSLYIPVRTHNTTEFRVAPLQQEADLVPRGAHLIPGNISLDAARTLLGRVVQSSKEPLPDPEVPRAQRRKINKFAAQHLGFAWGLQTAADGSPSWLHCAYYGNDGFGEYVIDLSGQKRKYQARSPLFIDTIPCAWLGTVVLSVDIKAIKKTRTADSGTTVDKETVEEEATGGALTIEEWYEQTDKYIKALNRKKTAPVVEVGPDGAFVGGDLGTSKGEADEFDIEIVGAKPGVWLMSKTLISSDDEDDGYDHRERQIIRFVWVRDGTVDYASLPRRSAMRPPAVEDDGEWEIVGTFGVDSGLICLFSKYAMEALLSTGPDSSKQAMLEGLVDDFGGENVFVPGGVVVSGDDGVFEVEGRRDASGKIVELRLLL